MQLLQQISADFARLEADTKAEERMFPSSGVRFEHRFPARGSGEVRHVRRCQRQEEVGFGNASTLVFGMRGCACERQEQSATEEFEKRPGEDRAPCGCESVTTTVFCGMLWFKVVGYGGGVR